MSESEHVMIEIPDIDSPMHVKAKPIGIEVEGDVEGDNDGKDDGGPGKEEVDIDVGVGVEETSGQVPEMPHQSGWECHVQVRDDHVRYSVSSYNRNYHP